MGGVEDEDVMGGEGSGWMKCEWMEDYGGGVIGVNLVGIVGGLGMRDWGCLGIWG